MRRGIPEDGLRRIAQRQNAQALNRGQEIVEDDVPVLVERMMAAMDSVVAEYLSPYMAESTERRRSALNVVEEALLKLPDEFVKRLWIEP